MNDAEVGVVADAGQLADASDHAAICHPSLCL
jgi:hypothetical protein